MTHCISRQPSLASRLMLADVPGMFSTNGGYDYYWISFFRLGLPQTLLKSMGNIGLPFLYSMRYLSRIDVDNLYIEYWYHLQTSQNMHSHEIFRRFLQIEYGLLYTHTYGYGIGLMALLNITTVPVTLVYGEHDNVSPVHQGPYIRAIEYYLMCIHHILFMCISCIVRTPPLCVV